MSGKSARETKEKLTQKKNGTSKKESTYTITVVVDDNTYNKLKRVSEEMGEYNQGKVLSKLCDEHDELLNSKKEKIKEKKTSCPQVKKDKPAKKHHSRYIPKAVKQKVLERSGCQCVFTSKITGERCPIKDKDKLHFDHSYPHSLNGPNSAENITLKCKHNLRAAITFFGAHKMSQYLRN